MEMEMINYWFLKEHKRCTQFPLMNYTFKPEFGKVCIGNHIMLHQGTTYGNLE